MPLAASPLSYSKFKQPCSLSDPGIKWGWYVQYYLIRAFEWIIRNRERNFQYRNPLLQIYLCTLEFENVIVSNFWLWPCIYLTFDLPECIRCLVRVWMWGTRRQRGCQSSCRWRGAECTTCPPTTSPGCSWMMTDGQTHVSLEKRWVIFVAFVLYLHVVCMYVWVGCRFSVVAKMSI